MADEEVQGHDAHGGGGVGAALSHMPTKQKLFIGAGVVVVGLALWSARNRNAAIPSSGVSGNLSAPPAGPTYYIPSTGTGSGSTIPTTPTPAPTVVDPTPLPAPAPVPVDPEAKYAEITKWGYSHDSAGNIYNQNGIMVAGPNFNQAGASAPAQAPIATNPAPVASLPAGYSMTTAGQVFDANGILVPQNANGSGSTVRTSPANLPAGYSITPAGQIFDKNGILVPQ